MLAKGVWFKFCDNTEQELYWQIDFDNRKITISDKKLRGWCFNNLSYPFNYPSCITNFHIEKYIESIRCYD